MAVVVFAGLGWSAWRKAEEVQPVGGRKLVAVADVGEVDDVEAGEEDNAEKIMDPPEPRRKLVWTWPRTCKPRKRGPPREQRRVSRVGHAENVWWPLSDMLMCPNAKKIETIFGNWGQQRLTVFVCQMNFDGTSRAEEDKSKSNKTNTHTHTF